MFDPEVEGSRPRWRIPRKAKPVTNARTQTIGRGFSFFFSGENAQPCKCVHLGATRRHLPSSNYTSSSMEWKPCIRHIPSPTFNSSISRKRCIPHEGAKTDRPMGRRHLDEPTHQSFFPKEIPAKRKVETSGKRVSQILGEEVSLEVLLTRKGMVGWNDREYGRPGDKPYAIPDCSSSFFASGSIKNSSQYINSGEESRGILFKDRIAKEVHDEEVASVKELDDWHGN